MESRAAAPPYQSSARFADSQCYPQYTASLKFSVQYTTRIIEKWGVVTSKMVMAWKSLARTKVNVKSILMFTRNARKRREKHDDSVWTWSWILLISGMFPNSKEGEGPLIPCV
ncbi:hypothetical protein SADUNF_Sadunf14G0033600 [Salix dunnii]|uniref:Uncharacterized protein n=1 Tax=Salix dunnii TaxID=1413687 RepID=A0A835JFI8_9ROSI|nr:hypothetical protein SADUNF_Sadunf14G0033600 [Salix dunnii]